MIWTVLNTIAWTHGSTAALPFGTVMVCIRPDTMMKAAGRLIFEYLEHELLSLSRTHLHGTQHTHANICPSNTAVDRPSSPCSQIGADHHLPLHHLPPHFRRRPCWQEHQVVSLMEERLDIWMAVWSSCHNPSPLLHNSHISHTMLYKPCVNVPCVSSPVCATNP